VREERRFGQVVRDGRVAVFEFDRNDLEWFRSRVPSNDAAYDDITEAMVWMDEAEEEDKDRPGIRIVVTREMAWASGRESETVDDHD
jgi:hypothetical protein